MAGEKVQCAVHPRNSGAFAALNVRRLCLSDEPHNAGRLCRRGLRDSAGGEEAGVALLYRLELLT